MIEIMIALPQLILGALSIFLFWYWFLGGENWWKRL